MNINKTAKAFAIAAVVGMSSQVFAATTNNWWNIDFQDATTITALTNASNSAGQWSTASGDASSIATGMVGEAESVYLKLDTQGNDIKWTPTTALTGTVVLVDSQVYLVGSDTAPTGFDADINNPVQTAVYLKNYIDSSNVTTSSVLCAYVENEANENVWVELGGVTMVDTNWYNLRIEVKYVGISPVASFYVGETLLNDANTESKTEFQIANNSDFAQTDKQKISSVSFRGTGSVDNFVGNQVIPNSALTLNFAVTFFTDEVTNSTENLVQTGGAGSVSQGTPWNIVFNYFSELNAGDTNYLSLVRVYTNESSFVDYPVSFDGSSWTLTGTPFVDDAENGGISYTVDTAALTAGYVVQAYYGSAPSAPTQYTVTFDANGGSGSMTAQSASTATALTANTFTKDGYTFSGWNTAANGSGTTYADGASYAFTADVTLYAQWTINQYTISFNSDGGSAVSSITQDYGTAVTAPAAPTKLGYAFAGWSPTVPETMPAESIELTAQWTPTQDVIFDSENANLAITSMNIVGTTATVTFTANGTITVAPEASSTLWVIVAETLGGTESYVEVEADVSSASNAIDGTFTVDLSTIQGTPDTLFVLGIRADNPNP